MSASDKKRQRNEALAGGLTQRQIKEQAEAQRAKRNRTIYAVLAVVCAVGIAALLIWNSRFWEKNAVAATVDGTDYTVPDLQYYYSVVLNNAVYQAQYYSYMGINTGYDISKSAGEQWYSEAENKTYADYFREQALAGLTEVHVLCKAANEAGYTLSDEGQKEVDDTLAELDVAAAKNGTTRSSYIAQAFGVSEKVYTRNLTNATLASEYSAHYADSISYDEAALEEYYDAHPDELDSYTYRYFNIDGSAPSTQDADGNTVAATDEEKEAAMAAAKEKADAAIAEIQAAEDKEQAFIDAAPKYVSENSKDAYTNDPSASLASEVLGSRLSQYSAYASTWLKDSARKSGDVTSFETTSGYQIVLFLERKLVTDPTVDVRHILIQPETSDDAQTNSQGVKIPTQEQMDAAKAKAESLLEEWKAGEATAESFGKLAEENSSDGGSNTNGGKYEYVYKGQMVPNFNDWCFDPARQIGDAGIVENSGDDATYYGYHVIYFEQENEPYWKHTAIEAKQSTDQSEWLDGLKEAANAQAADGMKYVGNPSTAQPTPSESPAESAEPAESATPTESAEASPAA